LLAASEQDPNHQGRLPWRGVLEGALSELGRPWHGGPFSAPARALLARTASQI